MATQMTFGGSPCPSLWGIISESLTYLSNAIIQNRHWDHDTLFDSISDELDSPLSLPDSIPFHPAKELAVTLPPNDLGKVDPSKGYHIVKKYRAEGRMEEQKTVLGWIVNTRTLKISLPPHRHLKWSQEIQKLLNQQKVKSKQLEAILERLNHVACIYNPMFHYLGRIYRALHRAISSKGWTSLKDKEVQDFNILLSFLDSAYKGVSLNNLTFRKPTQIYRSEALEYGLGGYNIISGLA
jgi:hypothetical protein